MPGPLLSRIPLIGKHLLSNEYLNKLSPTAIDNLGQTYRNLIGLGNNPSFASGAFKKLDQQRTTDNDEIPVKAKGPYGATLLDKMNDSSNDEASKAAKAAKNSITTALTTSDEYAKAMMKFNENSATFRELIKRIPNENFGAEAVLETYKYYIDKARAAIRAQQDQDTQKLTAQFDQLEFQNNLMTAFNIASTDPDVDQKINDIKTNMLKDLSAAQKKQLAEFDKSTSDSMNKLHQASAEEYRQMGMIETIKKANQDNVAMLDAIAEENRRSRQIPANTPSAAIASYDDTAAKVKMAHAKLEDIKSFKSMTGMEIEQVQPGVFKFHFDIISPRYYQSLAQKPLTDFLLVSQAIRAQGNDKISWTIEIEDPETLMERARQAVEGSVRAGFELDKIVIRDKTGKELKFEEIFKDDPETFNRIRNRAAEIKHELSNINPPAIKTSKDSSVKEAIKEIRDQHRINPPAEEVEEVEEVEEEKKAGPQAS
ncbi:coiled coil domain-containing protein [Legionella moravica]|uniref:Coiled coil domain protein n=1 Tax=Legionella moravica TaxID=39962 RepID=A0A378JUZ0_9GAMM|nr:hypothetical protein [Legionella moravica]KTD32307.1 coiled coil domain-containing protein [Legionella moravica]STX62404.1 coiled coil domain protein [Legionella moravica]